MKKMMKHQIDLLLTSVLLLRTKFDYLGAFAVTAGKEVNIIADDYRSNNDDYNCILIQALGDRLAEAYAEKLHEESRKIWGFGKDENLSIEDMIKKNIRNTTCSRLRMS